MDLFKENAFLMGCALGGLLISNCILWLLWFKLFKVNKFRMSIFFDFKFKLKSVTINENDFNLGWIPLGAYASEKSNEFKSQLFNNNEKTDTNQAFKNLNTFQKFLIYFTNSISIILYGIVGSTLLIGLLYDYAILQDLKNFLIHFIQTLFCSNQENIEFRATAKSIINKSSILSISILTTSILFLPFTILNNMGAFLVGINSKNNVLKVIPTVFSMLLFILFIWKIPSFIFNNIKTNNLILYILNGLLGIFTIGVCSYILLILSAKFLNKK